MVADAAQWNFSHQTSNASATLAPQLLNTFFLRAGTQFQNGIPLESAGVNHERTCKLADSFKTVFENQNFLNSSGNDMDLASGGILILPGSQLGAHPNLLVTCGKDGNIMLLDRDALGGFAGDAPSGTLGSNPNAVSAIPLDDKYSNITGGTGDNSPGPWGAPAYYNGADQQRIFYCGNGNSTAGNPGNSTAGNGFLMAFTVKSGILSRLPTDMAPTISSDQFPTMGTTPVVSSNNQVKDSAIVWAVNRGKPHDPPDGTLTPIALMAYDATNLGTALHPTGGWPIGTWGERGRAFIEPLVMNGKVYVASDEHVGVFYCANETKVA